MQKLLTSLSAHTPDLGFPPEQERYLPQRKVADRYGCSIMSLWRRERHPTLNFPKSLLIGNRRVYRLSDLLQFELECVARAAQSTMAEDKPISEAGRLSAKRASAASGERTE